MLHGINDWRNGLKRHVKAHNDIGIGKQYKYCCYRREEIIILLNWMNFIMASRQERGNIMLEFLWIMYKTKITQTA